ncbi:hypothetical protein EI94DRAFT_1810011 [Lactarius quietus]|nr:hypothetical protein EI94DRAFT_1810011 [Lactarius quietus]
MSIKPGRPYRIMNQMAGLALEVSDHAPFIVGEYIEPIDTQTWFVEPADFEGGLYIKSKANGKYIGVQLTPIRGVPVILVEREFAKVWVIETHRPANYQYDHHVLSSHPLLSVISFDRIKLRATDFVMEFAKENLHPGTEAKLAFASPEEINKVWVITEGES